MISRILYSFIRLLYKVLRYPQRTKTFKRWLERSSPSRLRRSYLNMQENQAALKYFNDSSKLLTLSNRRFSNRVLTFHHRITYGSIPLKDALLTLFHSKIQFEVDNSPIAKASDQWADLISQSKVLEYLHSEMHQRSDSSVKVKSVAIVSFQNWSFIPSIERSLSHLGVKSFRIEADRTLAVDFPNSLLQVIRQSLRLVLAERSNNEIHLRWKENFEKQIQCAETVWVEWAQRSAVMVSRCDLGKRKLVVRLHSYELSTPYVHLVNWARVDEIVVVSEIVKKVLPIAIPSAAGVPIRVIPNGVPFDGHVNDEKRNFQNIALVGWSNVAKDFRWALKVLDELNLNSADSTPTYSLHCFGSAPTPEHNDWFSSDDAELVAKHVDEGSVVIRGWSDSVIEDLQDFGFILSSSIRESFHVGLFEGISAGCVPVIRNWPYWQPLADAKCIFPSAHVVDSANEAAQLIRALSGDKNIWQEKRLEYHTWAKDLLNQDSIENAIRQAVTS